MVTIEGRPIFSAKPYLIIQQPTAQYHCTQLVCTGQQSANESVYRRCNFRRIKRCSLRVVSLEISDVADLGLVALW